MVKIFADLIAIIKRILQTRKIIKQKYKIEIKYWVILKTSIQMQILKLYVMFKQWVQQVVNMKMSQNNILKEIYKQHKQWDWILLKTIEKIKMDKC